ncbi:Uncharacterized conserved protein, DUF2267 family [Muriicola jejuensis]|uniref:DUF2267 domain-containing protein n=1 Tax=Muriicola jejuensis TaxID=504488 RepID=A0A6P0UKW6_9FLAO|nr:DUF2267 domain-containing protein [Muriicola jejuensis]NER10876.1 DUF2267 domain-containing protein [Muriicola jejuensis]SMP15877.1 Uncharacterized conserved protein, DUF2267 family [Muriicola jejuensis]
MALDFNKYAKEGNTFIKAYAKEMNLGDDTEKAGRIFSAIMHALREIITPHESLQLVAQMPMFMKAVYVNGWTLKKEKPKVRRMEEFVELVREKDGVAAVNDFGYEDELAERYIDITFIHLRRYISLGEMEDIRDGLPKELKSMIYTNLMF